MAHYSVNEQLSNGTVIVALCANKSQNKFVIYTTKPNFVSDMLGRVGILASSDPNINYMGHYGAYAVSIAFKDMPKSLDILISHGLSEDARTTVLHRENMLRTKKPQHIPVYG